MIDERTEAQASMYVLGALPIGEAHEFEQALRTDLELQLLVRELRAAADAMVVAFPQATLPPGLKQSIMAAVMPREVAVAPVVVQPDWFTRALQNWLPWALAACFAVLCILLIGLSHSFRQQAVDFAQELEDKRQQSAELQRQNEALQGQLDQSATNYSKQTGDLRKEVVQRVEEVQKQKAELQRQLEQKGAEVLQLQRQADVLQRQLLQNVQEIQRLNEQLTSPANLDRLAQLRVGVLNPTPDGPPRAIGASVWDIAEQKGVLVIENLTPLPPAQDYQLWLIDSRFPTPVSAGVFPVDARGNARLQFRSAARVDTAERFAVSVEQKGGVPAPQGKIVLLSN